MMRRTEPLQHKKTYFFQFHNDMETSFVYDLRFSKPRLKSAMTIILYNNMRVKEKAIWLQVFSVYIDLDEKLAMLIDKV